MAYLSMRESILLGSRPPAAAPVQLAENIRAMDRRFSRLFDGSSKRRILFGEAVPVLFGNILK